MDNNMAQHTERKIMEVQQCLDAFELQVLSSTSPNVELTTLQDFMESLRGDLVSLLKSRVSESKALLQSLVRTWCWLPCSPSLL